MSSINVSRKGLSWKKFFFLPSLQMHNLAALTQSTGPCRALFEFCGESFALQVGKQPGVIPFVWINRYHVKTEFYQNLKLKEIPSDINHLTTDLSNVASKAATFLFSFYNQCIFRIKIWNCFLSKKIKKCHFNLLNGQ